MSTSSNSAPVIGASVSASAVDRDVLRLEFKRNMGQISRQSLVFFAGTIFTMGAGYLVKIYVARVLGAEQLGLYALGMTLVTLTQLFAVLGLQGTAGRYVAVYNATGKWNELRGLLMRTVSMAVLLNLLFAAVMVAAGPWIVRKFYHAPDLAPYLPYFAALTVLGSLSVLYCQILAGFKDVAKRTVITNFIGSPLVIALTVVFLAIGTGMRGYLWAQIINTIVVVALLVAVAWKLTPQAARFSLARLPALDPEVVGFTAAAFGMGALDFLVSQADKVLLGLYLNPTLVGIYVVATSMSSLIPIILQSVNQIFAPVIADLHAQNRREVLERLFQTLTKWVLGLTFPLAFVVTVFARPLMRIFGSGFESGWPVLVIGALGQIINCAVGSVGYLLLMSGNQKRLMKVQFSMAAISLLVNITLIPVLGIVGAAVAAALVNAAGNLWNLSEVRKSLGIFPYNRTYFALILPATLAASAVLLVRWSTASASRGWVAVLLALVVSYAIFCGSAAAFALDQDDRMIALSAWAQLRGMVRKGENN